jgi:hypothetical protein
MVGCVGKENDRHGRVKKTVVGGIGAQKFVHSHLVGVSSTKFILDLTGRKVDAIQAERTEHGTNPHRGR